MRRTAAVVAGLAALAAVLLAVFSVRAAIAALAVSWLCGFGWMVLSARGMSAGLTRLTKRAQRTDTRLRRATQVTTRSLRRIDVRNDRLGSGLAEQTRRQQKTTDQLKVARRELYKVLVWVQRTPSVTHELGRVYERLVRHDRPMPELGDWAMSASTLIWLVDRIANSPVRTIVECGSGSSTIWFATALAQRGGEGKVVALESSAAYAETTRAELARYGLEDRAEVLHAPLVDTQVPNRANQPWFDLSVLPDLPPVDLLFVDGPVGGIARQARYPAYPLLANRLSVGATVVLDDTGRPDEAAIVKLWQQESFDDLRLREVRRLDRSVAFATERADPQT